MRSSRLPPKCFLASAIAILLYAIPAANYELEERKQETCSSNQFTCISGTCVSQFALCDGVEDCADGSDEQPRACGTLTCPDFSFQCDDGSCVDKDELCNGVEQCADGSDEKPEICNRTIKRRSTPRGCTLPPQPENGQYRLSGCEPPACNPVPGALVESAFINYTCNSGSSISGSRIVVCDERWSSSFPTCSREMCRPLVNPSRDIECTLNGKDVECDKPMVPGTRATVKCSIYYTQLPELAVYITECQESGIWNSALTSCVPKCGEPVPEILPLIAYGTDAPAGKFPWHAGIYKYSDGALLQVCGGTIISEGLLVSAAHCFWDEISRRAFDHSQYKVAAGKYFRDWNNTSRYDQRREIKEVVLHNRFSGAARHYTNDIALIILKEPLKMAAAVRPICVDYTKQWEYLVSPGKMGVVVGWGITEKMVQSDKLNSAILPYVDFETCEESVPEIFLPYLTADKFCLGYQNGTAAVCPGGDSGGGFASRARDGKWYLVGVISVGVVPENNDACNLRQYVTATRVSHYYDFLLKYKDSRGDVPSIAPPAERPPQAPTGCVLPSQPDNGEFAVQGCDSPCEQRPGSIVKHQTNLIFKCSAGFDLKGNGVVSCNKQDWSSSFPVCSRVSGLCPPLKNPTREIFCVFEGQDVDCTDNASRPGTRASVTCKPYYENVPGLKTYDIICNFNGTWSRDLQSCSPKCGEANPKVSPFIGSGYTPQIAEFPWHVGFYKIVDKLYPTPSCGGNIVAPRVVISAAHCFWNEGEVSFKEYRVVAGKYFRDWNNVTELVQHLEIQDVKIPKRYRGVHLNYANDIAVVVLKREIIISNAVRPLCVDFDKTFKRFISGKTTGKVAGWGYTENDGEHYILQAAVLKYVDSDECGKHMPPEYYYFMTHDKFCAGNLNKTTVCSGDSGGGYCVQQNGRWYLFGVVSSGPVASCGVYPYAAFTDIYENLDFVREHYFRV